LILGPGELIHINKGRFHCFRKLTVDLLPEFDCHAQLRKTYVETNGLTADDSLCVSVAWDWLYMGYTAEGINREISNVSRNTYQCRNKAKKALAPAEFSLRYLASSLSPAPIKSTGSHLSSLLGTVSLSHNHPQQKDESESTVAMARGILPTLQFIIDRERKQIFDVCKESRLITSFDEIGWDLLFKRTYADVEMNPDHSLIDPRGNDYYCATCSAELGNLMFHCNGCEALLQKDFNICACCYGQGKYTTTHTFNSNIKKQTATSTGFHTGEFYGNVSTPHPHYQLCPACKFCTCCSCRCHTNFSMHFRKHTEDQSAILVEKVKSIVGDNNVKFAEHTMVKLKLADDRFTAFDDMRKLIIELPRNKAHLEESCRLLLQGNERNPIVTETVGDAGTSMVFMSNVACTAKFQTMNDASDSCIRQMDETSNQALRSLEEQDTKMPARNLDDSGTLKRSRGETHQATSKRTRNFSVEPARKSSSIPANSKGEELRLASDKKMKIVNDGRQKRLCQVEGCLSESRGGKFSAEHEQLCLKHIRFVKDGGVFVK
jgi:hypothetical protein